MSSELEHLGATIGNQVHNVNIAAEIFNRYGDFIRGVIRCKVGDKGCVDNLFQNFFLSLVSKPPSSNIKNIKGYLYRAIINDIIDDTRLTDRYQSQMHRYAKHLQYSIIEDSPENALIEAEEMNKMFECIKKQLQHSEAQAIILRYRNNYKIKEVAAAMGVNNMAAWRYISKGLRKIRRLLRKKQLQ
jgi:RNA polymerase sigma factor (sigma-70 family)